MYNAYATAEISDFEHVEKAYNEAPTQWIEQISEHNALLLKCATIATRQTELMERLRLSKEAETETLCVQLVDDQVRITAGANLEIEERELEALDALLDDCKARMRALEATILTYTPQTPEDAAITLQFVVSILMADQPLDEEYLAHILEDCAALCSPVPVVDLTAAHMH